MSGQLSQTCTVASSRANAPAKGLRGLGACSADRCAVDRRVTFADSLPLLDQWPTFTIEMWIYPDYASPDLMTEPGVLGNGGPSNNRRLFSPTTEGPLILQLDVGFSTGTRYPNMYVPQQIWSHVVYTFNGQTMLLYRNGIFAEFDAVGSAVLHDTGGLFELGSRDNALTGYIDELRVSQSYRGPDWVYAQFLSMSGTFARVVPGAVTSTSSRFQ